MLWTSFELLFNPEKEDVLSFTFALDVAYSLSASKEASDHSGSVSALSSDSDSWNLSLTVAVLEGELATLWCFFTWEFDLPR